MSLVRGKHFSNRERRGQPRLPKDITSLNGPAPLVIRKPLQQLVMKASPGADIYLWKLPYEHYCLVCTQFAVWLLDLKADLASFGCFTARQRHSWPRYLTVICPHLCFCLSSLRWIWLLTVSFCLLCQVPEWTKCSSREKRKEKKVEKPFYSDSEGESGPTESADSGNVQGLLLVEWGAMNVCCCMWVSVNSGAVRRLKC